MSICAALKVPKYGLFCFKSDYTISVVPQGKIVKVITCITCIRILRAYGTCMCSLLIFELHCSCSVPLGPVISDRKSLCTLLFVVVFCCLLEGVVFIVFVFSSRFVNLVL